jgi:methyl-accepting chemotaxis protein
MKWLDDVNVALKLAAGFGLVVVLLVIQGVLGTFGMQTVNSDMATLYNDRTLPIEQVGTANAALYSLRGDLLRYVNMPAERSAAKTAISNAVQTINTQMNAYRATYLLPEEKTALADFDSDWKAYQKILDQTLTLVDSGKQDEAFKTISTGGGALAARQAVTDNFNKIIEINAKVAGEKKAEGDSTYKTFNQYLIIVGIVGLILAIFSGWFITRSVILPLRMVVKSASLLANGDLLREMSLKERNMLNQRKDELGEVGRAFDSMVNYLQNIGAAATTISHNDLTVAVTPMGEMDELGNAFANMVSSLKTSLLAVSQNARSLGIAASQLSSAADQAGQATSQISSTIQQIASGVSQQTASVTRTSASVEQMSRAIHDVARGAQEQARVTQTASAITSQIHETIVQVAQNVERVTVEAGEANFSAEQGSSKVQQTLQGMEAIRLKVGASAQKVAQMGEYSSKIGVIVETIEDISSQTNLLALNAAIEAARAGEHGKGFAVVADEVRKLAERSTSSTKEIGKLINGIQRTVSEAVLAMQEGTREVESGLELAKEAGLALESIMRSAQTVTREAEQAAMASQAMSEASEQLVGAVDAVSAIVEENTAATEQMAASSSEVTNSVENIASVSEENSAAVEEVSASTEEMSAQVEEVSASASSLREMAGNLKDLVSRFNLGKEESAPGFGINGMNNRLHPFEKNRRKGLSVPN